jgi:hypothetical protein
MAPQQQSLHARPRDTPRVQPARPDDRPQLAALELRRVTCVDASGGTLAMTRLDGRAPAGQRVVGRVPQHDGPPVTMLGALGVDGLQAGMTVDGATDAAVCRTYVTPVLGPTRRPGDRVVMDHWQAPKAVGVQQAMARRGARLLSVPPDSPDLSPIAPCGSTVNTARRQAKARTRGALDTAMAEVMVTVSLTDAWGWFKHGGYPLQQYANRSS